MQRYSKAFSIMLRAIAMAMVVTIGPFAAAAASETVLYAFRGNTGASPQSNLVVDSTTGELFGTTYGGGAYGSGTVFALTPPAKGATRWTITILHDFCAPTDCSDGAGPVAGLTPDGSGGFYGTASYGGRGQGTAYRLQPPAAAGGGGTAWSVSAIYTFCQLSNCIDGRFPEAGLIRGASGVLYGTTYEGGAYGWGTVFELTPPATGKKTWTETVLHSFSFYDGAYPLAELTLGTGGVLYGTTSSAGAHGYGTAYELVPPADDDAVWSSSVIYAFCARLDCSDGSSADAGLVLGTGKVLYGTTASGGSQGWGTVYELVPPSSDSGSWSETVIHDFSFGDGAAPMAPLILGAAGALYGTTSSDGARGYGTAFKLSPPSPGTSTWHETVLHYFRGSPDGVEPLAALVEDQSGAIYGTTAAGGGDDDGTVFELLP
jgi:uncharacterized repeat protein (TIGR03803 family)